MEKEFEYGLTDYLNTYFNNRDLESTVAMLSESVTGVGTGIDEIAFSKDVFAELFKRDIENIPNRIEYEIREQKIVPLSERIAVVLCTLDIQGEAEGQRFALNHLRLTLILQRLDDGRTLIEHKHISFPTDVHEEGEAYPLMELEGIAKRIESMVAEKTQTLLEAYRELELAVITDKLTGLLNRNRLDDLLQLELNRSYRYGKPFSLFLVDIDHFKEINDTHGHLPGDEVLVAVAKLVANTIRITDFAGRWGGDELVVILPETSRERAVEIAEKLQRRIADEVIDGHIRVTASFGVTAYERGDSQQSIFSRADAALYQAKQKGRNRVESDMDSSQED